MTAARPAERAGVSDRTVLAIEPGSDSGSSEKLMRVLWVFGQMPKWSRRPTFPTRISDRYAPTNISLNK
ncbi:hypothetical protein [Ferrimicrobium acidiphilum]|uniref:hypothetical protein n=1 Tax=Ferrimicrobium acidiphilum TaxID=121039 RepID=UPI0023F4B229|nr:hypothetical protein [Ferrimicrobium acidiphilum]